MQFTTPARGSECLALIEAAAPTAQAEVEGDFPWTWVIVGSVTAAAAIGATAYFMTQPADDTAVTATHSLD